MIYEPSKTKYMDYLLSVGHAVAAQRLLSSSWWQGSACRPDRVQRPATRLHLVFLHASLHQQIQLCSQFRLTHADTSAAGGVCQPSAHRLLCRQEALSAGRFRHTHHPQDAEDSVWVQLATEENEFGWTHESRLLPRVVPDDPISQFILIFSNTHLLIFMIVIVLISVAYLLRKISHSNARIVHFNDIDSPYPTALVLMVSLSAAFYATIQLFAPEMWRHFYFHPTLNPFAVPRVLGFFLASVWAILILALACLDEVKHRLSLGDAILYLGGLVGVCAVDYIIFSLCTLYYVGYVLLAFYFWFAIHRFLRR